MTERWNFSLWDILENCFFQHLCFHYLQIQSVNQLTNQSIFSLVTHCKQHQDFPSHRLPCKWRITILNKLSTSYYSWAPCLLPEFGRILCRLTSLDSGIVIHMLDGCREWYYLGGKCVQLLGEAGQECIHTKPLSVWRIENGADMNVSKPACDVMVFGSWGSCKLVSIRLIMWD